MTYPLNPEMRSARMQAIRDDACGQLIPSTEPDHAQDLVWTADASLTCPAAGQQREAALQAPAGLLSTPPSIS
jgi:hypothetical protein